MSWAAAVYWQIRGKSPEASPKPAGPWRAVSPGRLRNRLFFAFLSGKIALRQIENRPVIREWLRIGLRKAEHTQWHNHALAFNGHGSSSRRRGDCW